MDERQERSYSDRIAAATLLKYNGASEYIGSKMEGMWRAYCRPSTSCFLWVLLLVICWPQLRYSHCWVLRYYAEAIDFGRGAVFVLYDELRIL